MNDSFIESRKAISRAREALKNGNMADARQWAERAAELAPQTEDPWLILAVTVAPKESVKYINKALEINPNSLRAKQGMDWAMQRLGKTPKAGTSPTGGKQAQAAALNAPKSQPQSEEIKNPKKRIPILPILLILMGCAVFGFAAWSAVTSPVLASILYTVSTPPVVEEKPPFAQVNIAKPPAAAAQPQLAEVIVPTVTFTTLPPDGRGSRTAAGSCGCSPNRYSHTRPHT